MFFSYLNRHFRSSESKMWLILVEFFFIFSFFCSRDHYRGHNQIHNRKQILDHFLCFGFVIPIVVSYLPIGREWLIFICLSAFSSIHWQNHHWASIRWHNGEKFVQLFFFCLVLQTLVSPLSKARPWLILIEIFFLPFCYFYLIITEHVSSNIMEKN
jgi:hypothetical protein